jgi:hypothetical protein
LVSDFVADLARLLGVELDFSSSPSRDLVFVERLTGPLPAWLLR